MGEGGGGRRSCTQGAIRAEWRNQVSFLEGDSEPGLGVGGETQFGRGKWGNDLMMAPRWQERQQLPPTLTPHQAWRCLSVGTRASLMLARCACYLPCGVQPDPLSPALFPVSGRQCWHAAAAPSVWPEAPAVATGALWRCPRPVVRSGISLPGPTESRSLRQGPAGLGKGPHTLACPLADKQQTSGLGMLGWRRAGLGTGSGRGGSSTVGVALTSVSRPMSLDSRCASVTSWLP